MKTRKTYKEQKERARQIAIDWQLNTADNNMSYGELTEAGDYFNRLGKRFGLLREFRTNTIPC